MSKEKEQLTQQIMEIQRELIGNQQKYKLYESSILMARKNMERCKITMKEIEGLSENHKTYSSLGRAFFYQDKSEIMNLLGSQIKQNEKEIVDLEKTKPMIETKNKNLENQLTEMFSQLKVN